MTILVKQSNPLDKYEDPTIQMKKCFVKHTPRKINGWNLKITHLQRKILEMEMNKRERITHSRDHFHFQAL